jgi:hypothetical protein
VHDRELDGKYMLQNSGMDPRVRFEDDLNGELMEGDDDGNI